MANGLVKVDYASKIGGEVVEERKDVVIAIGKQYVVKGFDEALANAEIGKKTSVDVSPEKAYGQRSAELVRLVSLDVFRRQGVEPVPGLVVDLDGMPARVQSVSGGRVRVDFNHELAGKSITYEFTVKQELKTTGEKVDAIAAQFFRDGDAVQCRVEEILAVIELKPETVLKRGYLEAKGRAVSEILRFVDGIDTVRVVEEYKKEQVTGQSNV
ncbi:FKBP-type peptidyl-prolyl cis-trans isomerase [Candidatus Micrarchaeota archaeon]|nr:FKBP-type peptidyl-prolyl cis-trans isomerase [Candidatus Micrarchaeota archaeon]